MMIDYAMRDLIQAAGTLGAVGLVGVISLGWWLVAFLAAGAATAIAYWRYRETR